MSTYNTSLRYYKTYYEGIKWDRASDDKENARELKLQNELLLASVLTPEDAEELNGFPEAEGSFELQTTYPGLLIGSGITHGSGVLGELKLGFMLDYTTGLPYLPGSSVKGVLRSAFPQGLLHEAKKVKDNKDGKKELLIAQAKLQQDYILYHLKEVAANDKWEQALEHFENEVFGAYELKEDQKPIPMSGRVVFFDALISSTSHVRMPGMPAHTYLGDDFITPHKNNDPKKKGLPDEFVNPVPVGFLKVLPGVIFKFHFILQDYYFNGELMLSKAQMAELFKNLLLELGMGAKTNVGYGQFQIPGQAPEAIQNVSAISHKQVNKSSFEVGEEVEAYVARVNWADNKLELRVDGNRSTIGPVQVAKNLLNDLSQKRSIQVWVRAVNEDGSIKYVGITPPKS